MMKLKSANNATYHTQKGFTLIEALLALSITGMIYLISAPTFIKLYDYIKLNETISVLQSDLHYVREYNMMTIQGSTLSIRIYHKQNYYVVIQNNSQIKIKRELPLGVSIPSVSTTMTELTFNNLGHVSSGKTITIQSEHFKKNIVFSIGTGGIDIREAN